MATEPARGGATLLEVGRRSVDLAGRRRRLFSPLALSLDQELLSRLRRLASGDFLDLGCGAMPYRPKVIPIVATYDSLDIEARAPGVTILADVQAMPEVPDSCYDTVLCSEVLEHIPRPEAALAEIHRVLRPGGRLLLSVPFLSRLHEEPHDYFRYTEHGLKDLLVRQGFVVEEVTPIASVCSFLGHQVSTVLVAGTWRIPVLRDIVFALNLVAIVLPCYWLDRFLMPRRKLPAGYVAVALKQRAASPSQPTLA
jgi:SAM-dependent methyltransferase